MKQTAMQKLKWFVSDGLDCFDESIKVSEIWEKINELLEMEKQQVIDAVDETNRKWISKNTEVLLSGKQYYNETYNK